jgi:hypothetical protein
LDKPVVRIALATLDAEGIRAALVTRPVSIASLDRARGFVVVDVVATDLSVGSARYALHRLKNRVLNRPVSRPHLLGIFETPR